MIIPKSTIGITVLFFLPLLVFLLDVPGKKLRNKIRKKKGLLEVHPSGAIRGKIKRVWIFDTIAVTVVGYCLWMFVLAPLGQSFIEYNDDEEYGHMKEYYGFGKVESFKGTPIENNDRNNIILINKSKKPIIIREWRYEDGVLAGSQPISSTVLTPDKSMEVTVLPWLFGREAPETHNSKPNRLSKDNEPHTGVLPTVDFYNPDSLQND